MDNPQSPSKDKRLARTGIPMGAGIALGAALGAAMGNVAIGVAVGILVGSIGVAINRQREAKNHEAGEQSREE